MHYKMPWPNRELESARPFRRSPLYALLRDAGACFGSKMGWERANLFRAVTRSGAIDYAWGHQNWLPWVARAPRMPRAGRGVRHELICEAADPRAATLRRALKAIVANDVAGRHPAQRLHRHAERARRLRERLHGHAARSDEYMIVTGSAQSVATATSSSGRCLPDPPPLQVIDITSMYAVLAVMGPSRANCCNACRPRISTLGLSVRQLARSTRLRDGACDAAHLCR